MIYDIFNFLTGYVYVKLEGSRLERVLNSGITFWNTSRCGYSCIYANVSLSGYKRLKRIEGIKITLLEEKGLFFLGKGLWKSKVMLSGIILCCLCLWVLSNTVLGIEMSGNYSVKNEVIEDYVYEWGFKPFTFKSKLDLDGLCAFLRSKENIAWVSAGYDGVILNLEIIEQRNEYDSTPCDIVASRQAIIKKIDVYAGIRNKEIGDVVNEGELLVAGVRQKGEEVERIKSRATIIGTVWESDSHTVEAEGLTVSNTGNSTEERYIDFWGNKGYIQRPEQEYDHYVVIEEEKLLGGPYSIVPIKYVTRTYNEVLVSYGGENLNALTEMAGQIAFEKAVSRVPKDAKIVAVEKNYEMNDGLIKANVLLEVEMEIGAEIKAQ